MENIGNVFLMSILLCIISSAAVSGSPNIMVVIDGYTVNSTHSSPASLPLGTALVLVCRVSGIPQRQIKYKWICPDGPCERPGDEGRKVNDNILAVNITSDTVGGTYTCKVSTDEADERYRQNYTLNVLGQHSTMHSCMHIKTCTSQKLFILIQVYEMNLIIVIEGNVIHSYGRLINHEHVITREDQLLPPGDVAGPGRINCIRTASDTYHFHFAYELPNNVVNKSDGGDDQIATLFFNRSYLSMNTFKNLEGPCIRKGGNHGTYFYIYLLPGILSDVTIMSAVPTTTDIGIVFNNIPSDIDRVIVGYERHDLGVTLQGQYASIFRRTQHTFSSLVPGARYTVVVQGLTGSVGDRSQHVTRRDVKTEEKEPSAPRYSCILGESSDGIELNWIPPLEPNGDVYYLIDDGNRTVNTSSGSTYFNLTGLQRGVTYNITVVAMNSAGRSDTGSVLYYTYNVQSITPSQTFPTSSQNSPTAVIVAVAVVSIMTLLVIITILSVAVGLILKRKKQPPTVQCEQIYDEVDDSVKTDQDYQELDASQMDDNVMTSKDYQKLNVKKIDSLIDALMNKRGQIGLDASNKSTEVIGGEDYEELDLEMFNETTKYASLK